MKVLFAIRDESDVIDSLVRKYKKDNNKNMLYKEAKNFTAIAREVQENNDYDRIVISDNIDEKVNNSEDREAILLKKLKGLLSVAKRKNGKSIPIIFICKNGKMAKSLMELKIYNFLLKKDAGKKNIYQLINNPRTGSEAKEYYRSIMSETTSVEKKKDEPVKKQVEVKAQKKEIISNKPETKSETKKQDSAHQMDEKLKKCAKYLNREGLSEDNYVSKFEAACEIFSKKDIKELINNLNSATKNILKRKSSKYNKYIPKEVNVDVKEKQVTPEEPAEKKRGRGRPRKNPVPDENAAAVTTTGVVAAGAVKRGRGRPRKNPIIVETEETIQKVENTKKSVESAKNKAKNEIKNEENTKKLKNKVKEKVKEKVEEKVPEKIKKKVKDNEDWDLEEEDDIDQIQNNQDEFEFDFDEDKAVNLSNNDTDDFDDEIEQEENQVEDFDDDLDDEFEFDEEDEENSDDEFEFDEEDEENSDDEFEFDEEDEENSDDEFEFDEEDDDFKKENDTDEIDDETDEDDDFDEFDFDEDESTDDNDDDGDEEFDFDNDGLDEDDFEENDEDPDDVSSDDDDFEEFDFDEDDSSSAEDESDDDDEEYSFDDSELDEDDTEEESDDVTDNQTYDDDFEFDDFDDTESEDGEFDFDDDSDDSDELESGDEEDEEDETPSFDEEDEEFDFDDESDSSENDFDDEASDEDDFDFDEDDLANLDDEDLEDLEDDESTNQDSENEFDFNDDDNNLLDINDEDLENIDDDEFDALIADEDDDDEDDNGNGDLNLISDDDIDEVDSQDDIMDLDDDTDDDGILSSGSSNESNKGMIDFDSDMDEDEFVSLDDDLVDLDDDADDDIMNLDDDTEDDDLVNLDDETDDDDIMNLDDDADDDDLVNLDDGAEDDDIMNLDDEAEEKGLVDLDDDADDDLVNLDDESNEDSDNDFVFDLDENDDDLKVNDKPAGGVAGAAFSGIANKNYNPNYSISKQLDEINDDETSRAPSTPVNQNNQLVTVADTGMIDIGDNQKVVAFVGAHNSGNSFIVNNLAQLLSEQGVKTAVVDLTKNKNSYYIYTENEETLRNIAYSSFEKLKSGIADGIKVNKYLTVYTALPNSDADIDDKVNSMTTLLNNYSLVLLDCDFDTGLEFFNIAQDIFFVQSFDILTIQALTSFIKKLKMNKVEYENKMKIVINKYVNLSAINEKSIVAAMSVYNSPDTTYQLDLFDRNSVEYFLVPFEEKNYCKYLEEVVKCKLTIRGYSKNLLNSLNKLAKIVYPINGKKGKNK